MKFSVLHNLLKESYPFRIFFAVVVFVIIMSGVLTTFFIYHEAAGVRGDLMKQGKTLSELLAYSSRTAVFAENRALLKDLGDGVISRENVLGVAIYNANREVLISEWKKTFSGRIKTLEEYPGMRDREIMSTVVNEGVTDIDAGKGAIEFLSPVFIESSISPEEALYFDNKKSVKTKNLIGYVRVIMDKTIIGREIKFLLFRNSLIAFVFLLPGAAVIYLLVMRITKPLISLNEAAKKIGLGEEVEKIPVESGDEIGKLAMTFNDMSENLRKREKEKALLEEQLRLSQKMEAIGRFARGIAHDFNNILTTVEGSLFILKKKTEGNSYESHYMEQIRNSVSKLKNLIQGMIVFSRIQTILFSLVDVNDIIGKLKPTLSDLLSGNVEMRMSLSEGPLMIKADALHLDRVLINLCKNAGDAMPEGGILTIKTEAVNIDAEHLIRSAMTPGMYAVVSVADTGSGMDGETKERIFEPYFTTKETGKGIGLGLPIVFGIIEQHKGYIDMDTEYGKGTTFRIYLPLQKGGDGV